MKFQSLPNFKKISLNEIPDASTVLFYGGMKITQWFGNHVYRHPYRPPAYHAAFYSENGIILNVGMFKTLQKLSEDFRSTRRLDVIIYKDISADDREELTTIAELDISKPHVGLSLPDYDVFGFLKFGFGFVPQSVRKDFCSENVVQIFGTKQVEVSDRMASRTAPWHLFEYALKHQERCEIRTLWVGTDFKV